MRIQFYPTNDRDIGARLQTINEFNLNYYYSSNFNSLDCDQILWLDSFSDNARYNLYIYEVKISSFYSQNFVDCINVELHLNFDLPVDFKLFDDGYVDYWKDMDIKSIKPLIYSYGNLNLAKLAFNPLVANYFQKIYWILNKKEFYCRKINQIILLSFKNTSEINNEIINEIIEQFMNAIYEMVKATNGRYNYEIPEPSGQVLINMQTWYDDRRKKNEVKKKWYQLKKK